MFCLFYSLLRGQFSGKGKGLLSRVNGVKIAVAHAQAAFNALFAVDNMHLLGTASDGPYWAKPCTLGAATALRGVNLVNNQIFADFGRTALIFNMGDVLITEILNGGKHGV